MTRILVIAALAAALLLTAPLAVAVACTALAPALLTAELAGDSDPAGTQPPAPSPNTAASAGSRRPVLAWAHAHIGQPYRMGAAGPAAWDCSSFTQAAYQQVGVALPRTAQEQRDWLAGGHGSRIVPGHEQPTDLIFWDSYLGPDTIGHVVLVDDPASRRTVEAHNTRAGTGYFTYQPDHHRYEIWRPNLPSPHRPAPHRPAPHRLAQHLPGGRRQGRLP